MKHGIVFIHILRDWFLTMLDGTEKNRISRFSAYALAILTEYSLYSQHIKRGQQGGCRLEVGYLEVT